MTNSKLTPLESEVLKWLLAGESPILAALREQLASASILSRNLTGHGFYLNFTVPMSVTRLHEKFPVKPDFCFGDVKASIDSLEHGAGFLVWVKDGALDFLEGYTYDEIWPAEVESFELQYITGSNRDWAELRSQWEIDNPPVKCC
jgi:hypothetical protein